MALPTPEAATETRKFIKQAGGDSTWDRLAEYLEKESSGREKFVINRTFEAPLDLMFEMWTKPEHISQWLPPTGATMKYHKANIAAGGSSFFEMSWAQGMKLFGRAEYLKIQRPDTIVYVQQFCDENEKISRHPMAPIWPESMLTTVQLSEESPERTRVTITWEPYGEVTPEEIAAFVKEKRGMTQGWTGSFDKLEAVLNEHH